MASNKDVTVETIRKLVIIGDRMCGKTSLLYAFVHKTFHDMHVPTICDTFAPEIQVDGKRIHLALFDTAGQEDFDRLRPLSYSDTNVVLICFSVESRTSAVNIINKWNPEVRHYCSLCPVILVGTKTDLRDDPRAIERMKERNETSVTTEAGRQIAARIKADAYMECSAKTREGVDELFLRAARLSLLHRRKRSKCVLC